MTKNWWTRACLAISSLGVLATTGCTLQQKALILEAKPVFRTVDVIRPERGTLIETISFNGLVEPKKHITLHFLLPGRVESCNVRQGQLVKKGEELCKLDSTAVNLEVERARRAMVSGKKITASNLAEKQRQLFESGIIAQPEFEMVRLQAEGAHAQAADTEIMLNLTRKKQQEHRLFAPWNGRISKMLAKAGQPITPEIPALILSDESALQVSTELHAAFFHRIRAVTKGHLTSISLTKLGSPLELNVISHAPFVTPETQLFNVSLALNNPKNQELLAPGIIVGGEVELEEIHNALSIPESSLVEWRENGEASLYILEDQKLALAHVKAGRPTAGRVQILSGLSDNAQVIAEIGPDFVEGMPATPRKNGKN